MNNPTCPVAPRQPLPCRLWGHESPATVLPVSSPGSLYPISSMGEAPGCRAGAAIILWDENPRRTYSESVSMPELHVINSLMSPPPVGVHIVLIKKSSNLPRNCKTL